LLESARRRFGGKRIEANQVLVDGEVRRGAAGEIAGTLRLPRSITINPVSVPCDNAKASVGERARELSMTA
jgi:hypothetical protein